MNQQSESFMDINSIANKSDLSLRSQQQIQIEQISALTKALGLKAGSHFIAHVEKVTQANPAERAEILKSIETALTQLNKNSSAPAVKAVLAQLLEQKALAQQPNVKLVSLTASNPLQTSSSTPTPPATNLLSYSTAPVTVGQTLLMQLTVNQRVQLLEPITSEQLGKVMSLITSLKSDGKTIPDSLLEVLRNVQQRGSQEQLTVKAQQAIGESLRQLLPLKDRGQDLLGTLPKLTQFVQQLSPASRSEWLSSELQASLKTLANHIRLNDQLNNPKLLETVLNNNGQRFEQKLAQALGLVATTNNSSSPTDKQTTTPGTVQNPVTSALPTGKNLLSNTLLTMNATKAITLDVAAGNNKIQPTNVDKLAAQDLKGALLGVLNQLERELAVSSAAALIPISESGKLNLANALPQLLGFMMQKQPAELSQKQLRAQLVMLMHQYTLGSLAKIQLQQIHSLSHQLTQTDQPQPTQSWQMEIPVRQGQEVHPLSIQLEQKWIEDPDESNDKETKRVRQWNVMLGFDLPDLGRLYAQLGLLGERLSVKFWAEQEQTLNEAQTRLDSLKEQLEKEGIQIAQLQCVPGLPPTPKISLNYSLVDIKT
jgi:hypothetical protein